MSSETVLLRRLGPADVPLLRRLNSLFGDAFGEREIYGGEPPTDGYLEGWLAKDHVIVIAALAATEVVGGLVAYELDKFERMRREIYIYDLAVDAGHRRRHIATAMIDDLRRIASQRGVWVIYVQADYGDDPAIALYEKLGIRKEVLHFDIAPADHGR
ncbi:MAG: AAC(3)-I family aminoglycoside N-acetyltransferase [Terriglobia bacterium]